MTTRQRCRFWIPAGEVIGICGINKDFTAMKEIQDALAEERNRLKATTAELEAKNAVLEADLQLAREVQEALLPRDYPTFPGFGISGQNALSFAHCYLPAAAVGGDFFDIFPLSQTRAGILVCDVMGHGLRAALITAIIRALLEELRPMMHQAGRFLEALNLRLRAVLERVEEPFVATAFYMIVDTAAKEASYANAGHPGPFRICRKTVTVEPLGTDRKQNGPALGIFDSASFPTSRVPFDNGDCIVLFTDGIFEVYSPEGKEFGKEALVVRVPSLCKPPCRSALHGCLAGSASVFFEAGLRRRCLSCRGRTRARIMVTPPRKKLFPEFLHD